MVCHYNRDEILDLVCRTYLSVRETADKIALLLGERDTSIDSAVLVLDTLIRELFELPSREEEDNGPVG